jgi:intraflagellar transport protein 88
MCAAHVQVYERALPYFELAAAIQPQEVKWSLMVASCHRRIGAFDQARER